MKIAEECNLDKVLSFDMGGTTAKICMIESGVPKTSHSFEVARVYRFKKGSGLPLRIPVVELVEIGAGGGSIARVDSLSRITVGPDSAGSEPGPACYGRGGTEPTVTDADVILGGIDPDSFAAGTIQLDRAACDRAVEQRIGAPLSISAPMAAFGIREIVEENMAAAARVHAIESGMNAAERTMIAFGGAAPLHAGCIAEKLNIDRFIIPRSAGVGSAVGFLLAPVSYEVVRSFYQRLDILDVTAVNAMLNAMQAEASSVVDTAAPKGPRLQERAVYLRYIGQGHQLSIPVPARNLTVEDIPALREKFETEYKRLYSRSLPEAQIEILTWAMKVSSSPSNSAPITSRTENDIVVPEAAGQREIFDEVANRYITVPVYARDRLKTGSVMRGPAVIAEDETTTIIPASFEARINAHHYIECTRVGPVA
jgi:N-methylhydantoinase A